MSTTALLNIRDLLTTRLSDWDMIWLVEEIKDFLRSPGERTKPYTIEELHARLDLAEADSAAGRIISDEEVWRELEAELNKEDSNSIDARLRPFTMQEIDTMLDEAEAAFDAGDYLTNDEVFHH